MLASELIEELQKMIKKHGDRHIFSECDWEFVHAVEVGTEQMQWCVQAPYDTEDRKGRYKPVDVFVITG